MVVEDLEHTPGGTLLSGPTRPGPMATDREISCPSAGKYVSAYKEIGMSASTAQGGRGTEHERVYSGSASWRAGPLGEWAATGRRP